ncbi:MAG: hypothetical protein IJY39_01860 [Clostridia bacterium]|nr:hypothetical protein [Clostridia bacterium]
MKKQTYIEIMDRAFQSYTKEQIEDFFGRVKQGGLTEHGFPRLASNLGVLICHGRHTELLPLFVDLMDLCCEQMPKVHAANDFSVREVVTCIVAVEKAGLLPKEKTDAWREAIAGIDPWKCYDCIAVHPTQIIGNWSLFNAVSEYARVWGGFVKAEENADYMNLQIATQIRQMDEHGMYMDAMGKPYEGYVYPILYDYVPRVLFSFLVHFGYDGEHRDAIVEALERSADLTLKMQSVTGEIPFGGRSAQFMHNECTEAALLEFYASYFAKKGDLKRAGQFKRAARLAAENVFYWFENAPMKHVKNRYSIESKVGCEAYAYFDKYMITAASMAYLAYLYADNSIEECETCPAIEGGFVAQTTNRFHKYFLNKGGYFVEIDTNADHHYEGTGIGRVQKLGAPPQICLSSGFPSHPSYVTDGKNSTALSLCASAEIDGKWYIGAEHPHIIPEDAFYAKDDRCLAYMEWNTEDTKVCQSVVVTDGGIETRAEVFGDKAGNVGVEIPAFAFDGIEKTHIKMTDKVLTVEYKGYRCKYTTTSKFVDLGEEVCNRNGKYRRFRAEGEYLVWVKIEIEKI